MNPNNYASLEASKRLVAAGIVLETEKYWERTPSGNWKMVEYLSCDEDGFRRENYPAPSMAEVWRELPELNYFTKYKGHYQAWSEWTTFEGHGDSSPVQENTNPADALIDLLIWQRKEANHEG